ncbi:hypothetical protein GJ496_002102, partial [Pomphorhynchus laevis]
GILLLGFICAVSLPLKDARTIDSTCNVTKPRVNIQSSSVSYMFFCVVTLVTFLLLALLNTVELPALSTVRDFLSSIITVALVGGLSVLLFIVSATQAASEHKLSVCNRMASDAGMSRLARPGGPGASCFFGLAGIGAISSNWDQDIADTTILKLKKLKERLEQNDSVGGNWVVSNRRDATLWINSKVSGLSAGLIRRRLSVLSDLCKECGLELSIEHVQGTRNKADELTRVPKYWLSDSVQCCSVAQTRTDNLSILRDQHRRHHWRSNRNLFLVRRAFPDLTFTKKDAINIVKTCNQCNSIDPSLIVWNKGHLGVSENWYRVVIDITHFNEALFLTAIDCDPSRFTIWKHLRSECASDVLSKVTELFFENGWPSELW